jgi:large subunit ribosomal protein L24
MHVKKGDKVTVIAGKDKGTEGAIVRAFPKKDMVIIEGVNMVTRHQRAGGRGGKKGQILEKPMPIHASNVAKKK